MLQVNLCNFLQIYLMNTLLFIRDKCTLNFLLKKNEENYIYLLGANKKNKKTKMDNLLATGKVFIYIKEVNL